MILHEYGHALHFAQGFVFGSAQAGAISEGFADYWAVTVSDVVSKAHGVATLAPSSRPAATGGVRSGRLPPPLPPPR